MSKIHSNLTGDELHYPKNFAETPTDFQRAMVKQTNGSLDWVRTDTFVGQPGPPGPSIFILEAANPADPVELLAYDGNDYQQILVRTSLVGQEDKLSLYQWDISSPIVNPPFSVSGKDVIGKWTLISGTATEIISNSQASTTIIDGGILSINVDNTKVDISETRVLFVDNYTAPENIKAYLKIFPAQIGVDCLNIDVADYTLFAYDKDGNILKTNIGFTPAQRREYCRIGFAYHPSVGVGAFVESTDSLPQNNYAIGSSVNDLANIIGPQNVAGNIYSSNGTNLNIDKSSGETFMFGSNWINDKKNPNFKTAQPLTALTFSTAYKSTISDWTMTRNITEIDPNNWNSGINFIPVTAGWFTVQRIFWNSIAQTTTILYSQKEYATFDLAVSGVNDPFLAPEVFNSAGTIYRGALVVQQGVLDLETAVINGTAQFFNSNPKLGGSSASATTDATLQSAYESSVAGEITLSDVKGPFTLVAGSVAQVNLIEAKDELNITKFSVNRTGTITGNVATTTTDGLMSASDKTLLSENKIGWMQTTNNGNLVISSLNQSLTLTQEINSYSNGLFNKLSSTVTQVKFNGFVEISYIANVQATGNDGTVEFKVRKNGADLQLSVNAVSTGRGQNRGTAAGTFIVNCAVDDQFQLIGSNLVTMNYTAANNYISFTLKAVRVI